MTIILDGVSIPPAPRPGISYWYTSLTGWYDLTENKTVTRERPQAHGAHPTARLWRRSAAISFTVIIDAATPADVVEVQQQLAALGMAGPVIMQVTDALHTTERIVTVRAITVKDHHGNHTNEVEFDCLAGDPNRYSVGDTWVVARPPGPQAGLKFPIIFPAVWRDTNNPSGSDGRLVLVNRGVKPSTPTYRAYGPFSGFTLTNIGRQSQIEFDLPIPGGSFVEIDFAARTAVIDGQSDVTRYLGPRGWWDIPAGETVITQIDMRHPDSGSYCAGMVRSAW